ncbi:LuxR C-terminal-related transcriptional regulator [Streptomyces sp. NPDC090022]|uniref:LuxR C-terminal-related transcriptional regulator n=1 Tax=Streptomyces sp. NPDC090022 TaxID=3365920 RepID=UPI00381DB0C5
MTVPLSEDPLLAAKLAVPVRAPGLVRRPRLMQRLTVGTRGPLTLITGGAGFGKTALASSWALSRPDRTPVVWLTAEADDTPGVFWAYVVEGLRRHGVPAATGLKQPVHADDVARSFLIRLASTLEQVPDPLVMVVDGLDKLPGRGVHDELRFVMEHAGPALRLVLISREDPPLPLHRYRADGRVHEIREHDLAFTRHEAALLLGGGAGDGGRGGHGGPRQAPDDDVVDLLFGHTEGWAAGLRLCALALARSGDPAGFARSLTASEQAVSDYLLTEVLATQPEPLRDLLLRTGVLNLVHPDLADALTGRNDSEGALRDLARSHAFVEPLAGTRWYRFHPLFAEVLRTHLRSRQPELEPRLHRRAARWYAGRGRTAEAVAEAAAGGDWAFAAARTVQHLMVVPLLAGSGPAGPLRGGPAGLPCADTFARMPADTPGAAPALVAAGCRLVHHDAAGCRSWLVRAERRLARAGRPPDPATRLTVALLRLLAAPHGGGDTQARRVAVLMAELPPEQLARHPETEPLRLYGLACARLRAGDPQAARDALEQAVRACSGDTTAVLRHRCLGRLALADAAAGALTRAQEHATASLRVADEHGIPLDHRCGAAGLALATVALERGDLVTAAAHLERCEQLPDVRRDADLATECLVRRAHLELARGRWQAALDLLDEPARAGATATGTGTAVRLAEAHATAALAHGDPGTALLVLEDAPDGPPSRAVVLARAHLAAGHGARALRLIADAEDAAAPTLTDRVRLELLRAHHALLDGDEAGARDRLVQALDRARPELLRRPFTEAGPWVRHLAAGLDGRSAAYAWVTAAPAEPVPLVVDELSPREREVLGHVARMLSTEEVAAELGLSVNTVKTHLRGIYHKLGVSRRRDAVERARELHML